MDVKGKYVGKPMDGTNCWQFIVDYYNEELGIRLWDYEGTLSGREDKLVLSRFLEDYLGGCWEKVETPAYPDIVMFDISGVLLHGGIVLEEGLMLHMRVRGSLIERYDIDGFKSKRKTSFHGHYRYKGGA